MGYCNQPWISDYHFTRALEHRLRDEVGSTSPVAGAATMSLLLWGGIDAEGQPFLNPAFVADAPARLPDSSATGGVTGRDANDEELFSLRFAMPVVLSEEDEVTSSFAYALPVQSEWASVLSSITLSGPDGSVTLDGDTARPMAILRNLSRARCAASCTTSRQRPRWPWMWWEGLPDPAWRCSSVAGCRMRQRGGGECGPESCGDARDAGRR